MWMITNKYLIIKAPFEEWKAASKQKKKPTGIEKFKTSVLMWNSDI